MICFTSNKTQISELEEWALNSPKPISQPTDNEYLKTSEGNYIDTIDGKIYNSQGKPINSPKENTPRKRLIYDFFHNFLGLD